jgi:predicted ATPase
MRQGEVRPVLRRLKVSGFKSLRNVEVIFPKLTVLFGPNAAGKSNVLDAIQLLSRLGTERTLMDAFDDVRGYSIEAFSFPAGGLPQLLSPEFPKPELLLEADIAAKERYRYRLGINIDPRSGVLSVTDEYLSDLSARFEPRSSARIERLADHLSVRRRGGGSPPRLEDLGKNYSVLSDARYTAPSFGAWDHLREELNGWRAYYLDPRMAMRWSHPPQAVRDIGQLGETIAPFLYRLKAEYPKHFNGVRRTLSSIIPTVEDLNVDLDQRRGTLDITIKQGGTEFSSRIISEGTLRVLALCAIAINPWNESLLAFEEPENGVHPRRLQLIAELLYGLATTQNRQLIVTTHSLLFCDAMLRKSRESLRSRRPRRSRVSEVPTAPLVGLLHVRHDAGETKITPFDVTGPLFQDTELRRALTSGSEDGLFESLMLRGLIDE